MALTTIFVGLHSNQANAAGLGTTFVRFDRMKISQTTTGTVCAKPVTASVEATVQVTFPTGYTLGAFGTFTTSTTNTGWPTGGTAWLGINTATAVAGQVVTFPSTDLVVGTLYCFNWTNPAAVTVKSSASSNNTRRAGESFSRMAQKNCLAISSHRLPRLTPSLGVESISREYRL